MVHQARTSTFLQALRDLNNGGQFTFKAPNTILKLLAKTAITAVPHCVYHQTPLKKKLKKLKKTNPTFAWSIKQIGRYGIPLVVDFAVEEMWKN